MTGHILDPEKIIETIAKLSQRIQERFPGSNLGSLCSELLAVARKAVLRTAWIRQPLIPLRIGVGLLLLSFGAILVVTFQGVSLGDDGTDLGELVQSFEAMLSSGVFIGVAAFFLITLEIRVKRRRALRAIRELRTMAHTVDMCQLTKDPQDPRLVDVDTASSPSREMIPYELGRYLDYCSEMLALTSKIAALYVHDFDDPVALGAVDGLQRLIDGLSHKLWHKMAIVDRIIASQEGGT